MVAWCTMSNGTAGDSHRKSDLNDTSITPFSPNSNDVLPDLVVHACKLSRANLCLDEVLKLRRKGFQLACNRSRTQSDIGMHDRNDLYTHVWIADCVVFRDPVQRGEDVYEE